MLKEKNYIITFISEMGSLMHTQVCAFCSTSRLRFPQATLWEAQLVCWTPDRVVRVLGSHAD